MVQSLPLHTGANKKHEKVVHSLLRSIFSGRKVHTVRNHYALPGSSPCLDQRLLSKAAGANDEVGVTPDLLDASAVMQRAGRVGTASTGLPPQSGPLGGVFVQESALR
jgi:hypothetical protein